MKSCGVLQESDSLRLHRIGAFEARPPSCSRCASHPPCWPACISPSAVVAALERVHSCLGTADSRACRIARCRARKWLRSEQPDPMQQRRQPVQTEQAEQPDDAHLAARSPDVVGQVQQSGDEDQPAKLERPVHRVTPPTVTNADGAGSGESPAEAACCAAPTARRPAGPTAPAPCAAWRRHPAAQAAASACPAHPWRRPWAVSASSR